MEPELSPDGDERDEFGEGDSYRVCFVFRGGRISYPLKVSLTGSSVSMIAGLSKARGRKAKDKVSLVRSSASKKRQHRHESLICTTT